LGFLEIISFVFFAGLAPAFISSFIAIAMNEIYGITRVLNLAQGAFMTISAYLVYYFFASVNVHIALAILFSTIITAFAELLFVYALFLSGILRQDDIKIEESSIIITFGVMLFIQGMTSIIFGATPKAIDIGKKWSILPGLDSIGISVVIASLLIFTLVNTLLFSTKFTVGRWVRSTIQDKDLANIIGINIEKIYLLVGFISGVITGLAGGFYALLYGLNPYFGLYYTIVGFVAMAVAGIGNHLITFILSFVIVEIQSLLGLYVTVGVAACLIYIFLIFLLVVKPKGLRSGLR